ncbi:hypothetical protein bcere0029_54400 [Bacillus cereus AH1272]|nr:hypothetical protein bcere0029_54400 [Bacillus cereus AH1272]
MSKGELPYSAPIRKDYKSLLERPDQMNEVYILTRQGPNGVYGKSVGAD